LFDPYPAESNRVADFHIHPNYSIDARGSLDDYCEMAMRRGLSEICFTTHYDSDPARLEQEGLMVIEGRREKISDETLSVYFKDIARVHHEYGQFGFMVRGGLEFGFYEGCGEHIAGIKGRFPVHYCLGAVHSIGDACVCCKDESRRLFESMTLDRLADTYFDQLDKCAATGLFDSLAHIDVYRRYGLAYYGEAINTIHRGRIEKVFETMKAHDVGYEVNTSAIRHGHFEYYPGMEIINMARAAGVRIIALGSDAHCPEQMALDFDAAVAVAYDLFPYVDE